jgi:hypothetical protein
LYLVLLRIERFTVDNQEGQQSGDSSPGKNRSIRSTYSKMNSHGHHLRLMLLRFLVVMKKFINTVPSQHPNNNNNNNNTMPKTTYSTGKLTRSPRLPT